MVGGAQCESLGTKGPLEEQHVLLITEKSLYFSHLFISLLVLSIILCEMGPGLTHGKPSFYQPGGVQASHGVTLIITKQAVGSSNLLKRELKYMQSV